MRVVLVDLFRLTDAVVIEFACQGMYGCFAPTAACFEHQVFVMTCSMNSHVAIPGSNEGPVVSSAFS